MGCFRTVYEILRLSTENATEAVFVVNEVLVAKHRNLRNNSISFVWILCSSCCFCFYFRTDSPALLARARNVSAAIAHSCFFYQYVISNVMSEAQTRCRGAICLRERRGSHWGEFCTVCFCSLLKATTVGRPQSLFLLLVNCLLLRQVGLFVQ